MSSRSIPQHRMGKPRADNGHCTTIVPQGRTGHRAQMVCGQTPDHPCHRFYPCREGCRQEFNSCEQRDMHEANVHGEGW